MQIKYMFNKIPKKQILMAGLQNYAKMSFKRLYKNFSYLFFSIFLNMLSNSSYPNFKIILAYFYIIKTI